jgi:hypothetical protein
MNKQSFEFGWHLGLLQTSTLMNELQGCFVHGTFTFSK